MPFKVSFHTKKAEKTQPNDFSLSFYLFLPRSLCKHSHYTQSYTHFVWHFLILMMIRWFKNFTNLYHQSQNKIRVMLKSSQTTNYINALYTLYGKICSTFIIFQNVIKIFYFKTREKLPYAKKKKKKM